MSGNRGVTGTREGGFTYVKAALRPLRVERSVSCSLQRNETLYEV